MADTMLNNRYEIKEELHTTLLTTVYQALDTHKTTPVLVHIVRKDNTSASLEDSIRFKEQAKKISPCSQPQLVTILDMQEDKDVRYYISKFFEKHSGRHSTLKRKSVFRKQ